MDHNTWVYPFGSLNLFSKNWMEMANKEIGKLMCGFAGVLGDLNSDIRDSFLNSSNKINYRGPDDNSIFDEENLLINFFRLSIIDIDQGNQPKKAQMTDTHYFLMVKFTIT